MALKILPFILPLALFLGSLALIGFNEAKDKSANFANESTQHRVTEQTAAKEMDAKSYKERMAQLEAENKVVEKAKEEERLQKAALKEKEESERLAANARLYAISFGQSLVVESLRDPESVQWKWKAVNLDNGALCYLYRAKNGFGGYMEDGTVIHNGEAYTSTAQWNKLCGKSSNYEEY